MAHRCCFGWLDLARGAVYIAVFYVCYFLLLTVTLFSLAIAFSEREAPLPGLLSLGGGGALLLAALAGGLLLGAVRRRRPLLLLWLIAYGAVLLTLSLTLIALTIATASGYHTPIREFCEWLPRRRCPWRLFHLLLLLFALEGYWWVVVLLRYRQLGREQQADPSLQQPPSVQVRGAHDGKLSRVPVVYEGDVLLESAAAEGGHGREYGSDAIHAGREAPANTGRFISGLRLL